MAKDFFSLSRPMYKLRPIKALATRNAGPTNAQTTEKLDTKGMRALNLRSIFLLALHRRSHSRHCCVMSKRRPDPPGEVVSVPLRRV